MSWVGWATGTGTGTGGDCEGDFSVLFGVGVCGGEGNGGTEGGSGKFTKDLMAFLVLRALSRLYI